VRPSLSGQKSLTLDPGDGEELVVGTLVEFDSGGDADDEDDDDNIDDDIVGDGTLITKAPHAPFFTSAPTPFFR